MPVKPGRAFETTRWSLIGEAGSHAEPALSELCRIYWTPVFAFFRSRCHDSEEARDLTQSFFASLLEKDTVARADPARGRFRSFLLKSAHHFYLNEVERNRCKKRGGGVTPAELDDPERGFEPVDSLTPEIIFAQEWALTVLKRVLDRFLEELSPQQKTRFQSLKGVLLGTRPSPGYAQLSQELGISEAAVRVTAHRFRKQFGQYLREEVADTVHSPETVDDEIRFLLNAFASAQGAT